MERPAKTLVHARPETHLRLLLVCGLCQGRRGAPGRAIAPPAARLPEFGADRAALRATGLQGPLGHQGVRGGRQGRHSEPPKGAKSVF